MPPPTARSRKVLPFGEMNRPFFSQEFPPFFQENANLGKALQLSWNSLSCTSISCGFALLASHFKVLLRV